MQSSRNRSRGQYKHRYLEVVTSHLSLSEGESLNRFSPHPNQEKNLKVRFSYHLHKKEYENKKNKGKV